MIRALIIEDSPGARRDLKARLQLHPEVAVIGEAPTVGRARTLLALDDYDLVFLDIQLRGGDGFDLVPAIRPEARIIFVTAFDQHAIRAFEVNAVDYLLKPVKPVRLAESLKRLQHATEKEEPRAIERDLVHLRTDSGSHFVPASDIVLIRSEQNYTHVHTLDGTKHLPRKSLKAWEDLLVPRVLRRVAREALVNLQHASWFRSTSELKISGCPDRVTVSGTHLSTVRKLLKRQG